MDKRVDLVQDCHDVRVVLHEKMLDFDFCGREEALEGRFVLEVENADAMVLCQLHDSTPFRSRVERGGGGF